MRRQHCRTLLASAVLCTLLGLIVLPGCQNGPEPDDPDPKPPAENGEEPVEPAEAEPGSRPAPGIDIGGILEGGVGSGVGEYIKEAMYLRGADRPPLLALKKIREVHDMKDWSYAPGRMDGVAVTRDAIADLRDSDYTNWDETGIVVVVLSTLAARDRSAVVRDDCVECLAWFRSWIRPLLAGVGEGVRPTQEEVVSALKALDVLHETDAPPTPSDLLVTQDAVAVLGSYDWGAVENDKPLVYRSKASRPRGVIRRLTARDLEKSRQSPQVRTSLDRAIIRVADKVVFLSLVAALGDPAGHVRTTAAKVLGEADEYRAMGALLYTLEREEEPSVRLALVGTIGTFAMDHAELRPDALPEIADALSDPDSSVRRAAAREMARITGEDPGPDPVDWRRWWLENRSELDKR